MAGKKHEPRFPTEKRDVTSKNIGGISDLVVWAPIKEGFIDAFGNVTYASRLRIVTEALNNLRKNVREFQLSEPFADSTKRILSLLDFRIGIVERDIYGFGGEKDKNRKDLRPRQYMYLTATFDGPWEPYMRQIWDPLGPFLDLVLCNCEGYLPAQETDFETYIQWVRDHSLDTGMFYLVMGQTVKDHLYLGDTERIERETEDADIRDIKIATHRITTPEEDARRIRNPNKKDIFVSYTNLNGEKTSITQDALTLALEALNVLFQLTRYYPADSHFEGHGEFLWKATQDILEAEPLKEYIFALINTPTSKACKNPKHKGCKTCKEEERKREIGKAIWLTLRDQLEWYTIGFSGTRAKFPDRAAEDHQVQKGLLTSYDDDGGTIKNSAMLLLKITDVERVKLFLHPFFWSWEERLSPLGFFRNLALTYTGIEKLPFSTHEIRAFPKEFRQGMEERAPHIGDIYHSHPQRWTRPRRNGFSCEDGNVLPRVSLHEVHMVAQLRVPAFAGMTDFNEYIEFESPDAANRFQQKASQPTIQNCTEDYTDIIAEVFGPFKNGFTFPQDLKDALDEYAAIYVTTRQEPQDLIHSFIEFLRLHGRSLGVEILSLQSSFRSDTEVTDSPFVTEPTPTGHFGFKDGISQPVISARGNLDNPMAIRRGDLILGHSTQIGDPPTKLKNKDIQKNGSFLAIRKMRQDVEAFETFINSKKNTVEKGLTADELAAKMMGRSRDGKPLIDSKDNNFDYQKEMDGTVCPFTSHIRRANPRDIVHGRKAPKILRRGMSYGKKFEDAPETKERGSIFMAYCSNLAEQYELVQRWVNGGNSTDIVSSQVDPIISPPPRDGADVFKFPIKSCDNTEVLRFHRDPCRPFVQLEWGLYAFAPGKNTLEDLISRPSKTCIADDAETNESSIDSPQAIRGRKAVEQIENLPNKSLRREHWKVILEDFLTKDPAENNTTSDVMAFIREKHDGVYKIPDGVLGADKGSESIFEPMNKTPVLIVADKARVRSVLKQPDLFSSRTVGNRLSEVFAEHYIGLDPAPENPDDPYLKNSWATNNVLLKYTEEQGYAVGYKTASTILNKRKSSTLRLFSKHKYKIELTRELFATSLAGVCHYWFGIPDDIYNPKYFMPGGFPYLQSARGSENRLPRCPGDFLAPSRGSFYPRPTPAIASYAKDHGGRLKKAVEQLTEHWKKNGFPEGSAVLAKKIYNDMEVKDFDLLGRNLVGAMVGMLPSSEASLRAATYDWSDTNKLWQIQGDLVSLTNGKAASFEEAEKVIKPYLVEAMSKRPAPDLLYRTATKPGKLGGKAYNAGDTVILSLASALQADLDTGTPDISTVFGDYRDKECPYNTGRNPHACPATDMAMGNLLGILTALLQAGAIQTLPASLIWQIDFEVSKAECPPQGES